jgi:hypothetical protein
MATPDQAQQEATRRFNATNAKKTEWPRGWSQSPLRNDEPEPEKDIKKKKKDSEKAKAEAEKSAELSAPAAAE